MRLVACALLSVVLAAAAPGRAPGDDGAPSGKAAAPLLQYVARPEPAFRWELRGSREVDGNVIHDLRLVSQDWQGIVWEHDLQVFQPAGAEPKSTMLLWNQGGSAGEKSAAFGLDLASRIRAPVAFLYGIPNQPLFEGKKEDTLIAETFVRYLETGDENWPLLFPMVKSLVKAMDALQAFAKQQWQQPVEGFLVTGASKRGWTTWLTAAADPRVVAVAPMVIDTLNMPRQMEWQLASFGQYSEQIVDYTARGLVPVPDTPAAKRLWQMVDPWVYRERIAVPKLIINGSNDPYWTTDALNLYWNDLKGDKWVLYVPNAGHNLEQQLPDGRRDRERALNGLAAFARHIIGRTSIPRMSWKHEETAAAARLTVEAATPPKGARLWIAQAPTRDFRNSAWKEEPARIAGQKVSGEVAVPPEGYIAFFAELDFEADGLVHQLSTQLRIVGPAE